MSKHDLDVFFEDYNIDIDENRIAFIQQQNTKAQYAIDSLAKIESFSTLILNLLRQDDIKGVIYSVPHVDTVLVYKSLIETCFVSQRNEIVNRIYQNIGELLCTDKPVIALISTSCHNLSLSCALWAKQRLALASANLGFEDTKYGLFGGLGINSIFTKISTPEVGIPFLLQQVKYTASEALQHGLIKDTADDVATLVLKAKELIAKNQQGLALPKYTSIAQIHIDNAKNYSNKYAKRIPKGPLYGLNNIQFAHDHGIDKTLIHEQELFLKLWRDPITIAYLRTQYFGIKEAIQKAKEITLPDYEIRKLAIIGAGMMGAGIAFEAAKAGISVVLKDSTQEIAVKGKAYSEQVSAKLVQQKRMTEVQQQQLLSRIQPTAELSDFDGADLIIEAVNEDKSLKAKVSAESVEYLQEHGFFASNTTSIPIGSLAAAIPNPSKFIGMHFFSPVDRMALVEIIKGEKTDNETLRKAIYVSAQLGKIPIVVHDGPAFFTSRIFFNYLLEAITMVLEGIDPQQIEEQAKAAGFAASPLAVLDEISLPLMLQVYNQLPQMHAGQRRIHSFLTEMVSKGRLGRKSNLGFYTYASDGKELWKDPTMINNMKVVEPMLIQKRLLHVVALDSYRCLESGIVSDPIDADLGSILGLGYPAITGGVISYIDLIGIQQFVYDCKEYESYGPQWELSERFVNLANGDFCFYTGLASNWKREL